MRNTRLLYFCVVFGAIVIFFLPSRDRISARPQSGAKININTDDIGGVVTSSKGPEAGVWSDRGDHRHTYEICQDRCHR